MKSNHEHVLNEQSAELLEIFDAALALADVRVSGEYELDIGRIIESSMRLVLRIIPFDSMSVFLVDEQSMEFLPYAFSHNNTADWYKKEFEEQVSNGNFAWALDQHRLILVPSSTKNGSLGIHVISTRNEVVGVLLAELQTEGAERNHFASKGLSLLLANTAYMIESSRLAHRLSEQNRTLEKQVEERTAELHHALDVAQKASSAKSDFLAVMTHEIRTPMNAIIGMTDLTLETSLNEEQRSMLSTVKDSSDRLLNLVNDILDFSKIEAGKMQLSVIPFDLSEMVTRTIQILSARIDEKNLEIVTYLDPRLPPWVLGDPHRLRQILINLIGNAIKFTQAGGGILCYICRESAEANSKIHFCVADSGQGIPKSKQEIIFDSFSQVDNSTAREYGGTGLGLAITSQLVGMMRGKIWVESQSMVGSAFHFIVELPEALAPHLPTSVDHKHDQLTTSKQQMSETPSQSAVKAKLLIVDDNQVNRHLLVAILSKNYQLETAVNGEEALMKVSTDRFDLILMDCQMPVMDGFEATTLIRQLESSRGHRTPIIAVTALAIEGDRERCIQAGMDDYLTKPIHRKQAEALIRKYLAGS